MAISVIAFSERREAGQWVLVEREVMFWHSSVYSGFSQASAMSALFPLSRRRVARLTI